MARKRKSVQEYVENGEKQQLRAGEIQNEITEHKERVDKLLGLLETLKNQQNEIRSSELDMAIINAERARNESEDSLKDVLKERDDLLAENQEMTEKINKAYGDRRNAKHKLEVLMVGATGKIAGELQATADAQEVDLENLAFADSLLATAKKKLVQIN